MSKPSKHRRLVLPDCIKSPSCQVRDPTFSFYHSIVGRDDDNDMRLRSPWEMSWEHIHQCYVEPLLRAKRSGCLRVSSLDVTEAAHLSGFVILVVSALTTAVLQDNIDSLPPEREDRCSDLSDLLQLLDQLHLHISAVNANAVDESNDHVASDADDFTTLLKFCLAVDSAWQQHDDDWGDTSDGNGRNEVGANGRDRFQRDGSIVLQHLASRAMASALQTSPAEQRNATDLVRYWCLAIVSWGRPASVRHKERCRLILEQLRLSIVVPGDAIGGKPPNGLVVRPYIDAATTAVQEFVDEGHQQHVCELNSRSLETSDSAISAIFALCIGETRGLTCFDCTRTLLCKLRLPCLQGNYDVAVCLCLIARHFCRSGFDGQRPSDSVRSLYQSLGTTLIGSANEETEQSVAISRISVLGVDFLLRSTELSSVLPESVQHELSHKAVPSRAIVKVLVQLILTHQFPSQLYSTTTCTLDVESLLYSDLSGCPEVAAARVLIAYLKLSMQEYAGVLESSTRASTDPHVSKEESPPDVNGIPLNDAVNICLVLMDSKNQHVVEVVLSSFLCRLWQRDEAVGRSILVKRPEILSSMALVVTRRNDNLVVGRAIAKVVSESWLAMCTCPDDNFRSWIGYVFVRQEAALSALVSLCHDPETSRAALQTLLVLSEEISNHRLLARQPGLLTTLIRLVRDGAAAPMQDPGTNSLHFMDRESIKHRILDLADVL